MTDPIPAATPNDSPSASPMGAPSAKAPARYDPHAIEAARQSAWREREAHATPPVDTDHPHRYIKPSAPFTSGNIHIGHVRSYSIGDAYARYIRARGEDVLFAFGFDAFGLPAELGAIERGIPPSEWVARCAEHMRGQLERLGYSLGWDRVFMSSDPIMYRWSQWLFLALHRAGLVYLGTGAVDWCDTCQTTLATIQVEAGGRCWRCHNPVRLVQRPQWYLRISPYLPEVDRNIEDLTESGAWDEVALSSQRFVLGRVDGFEVDLPLDGQTDASDGAEEHPPEGSPSEDPYPDLSDVCGDTADDVAHAPASDIGDGGSITVFTPYADGLSNARFVLISPRHPYVERFTRDLRVRARLEDLRSGGMERDDRDAQELPLVATGHTLSSPASPDPLPVVISPVVDGRYGPTAILGVPEHDHTDASIAQRLGLDGPADEDVGAGSDAGAGMQFMRPAVRYRASDFSISRQRSWGTPIPIVHCAACGTVPVPEEQLPVLLPLDLQPTGTGNPLAEREDFVNTTCPSCGGAAKRETDTLDCHFDALWLWVPVCVPPQERERPLGEIFALDDLREWLPCERVVAGSDSGNFVFDQRITTMALRDIGPLAFLAEGEPFAGCLFHEMVIRDGRKMSKHLGNVVDPDELVARYGADTVRLATLYAARPQRTLNWSDSAVLRCHRFLNQVWEFALGHIAAADAGDITVASSGPNTPDVLDASGSSSSSAGSSSSSAFNCFNADGAIPGHRHRGDPDQAKDKTEHLRRKLSQWCQTAVQKTTEDLDGLEMHTAVRNVMRLFDRIKDYEKRVQGREEELSAANRGALLDAIGVLAQLLAPFAPHIAEELWIRLGNDGDTQMPWPGVSSAVAG